MLTVEMKLGPEAMRLLGQSVPEIGYFCKIPSCAYGIMVVAVEGQADDWAAYVTEAARGAEYCERQGDKLGADTAAVLFPWMAERFEYRL